MSHPGGFPGDPAGGPPDPQQYQGPGPFDYPPIADGPPPPGYPMPPPAYSPVPPGAFPPPPPYRSYDHPHPQYPHPQYPPCGPQAPANGLAIGALVSSLVAIPAYFLCFGFIGSLLGIVLGGVALAQIGKSGQRGKGMAIAGIVLGLLGLVVMGLFSLLIASPSLWY